MQTSLIARAKGEPALLLSFGSFVALGVTMSMLSVAWPSIRADFGLSLDDLVALLISSTIGFVTGSVLAGQIMARLTAGWAVLIANLIAAAGFIGYSLAPGWWVLVALGLMTGWGHGLIDTALNIYVAATRSVRTMNWMHASFGVGATIGPLLMTAAVESGPGWRLGYAVAGGLHLALGLAFFTVVRAMNFRGMAHVATAGEVAAAPPALLETLRLPVVWLSILLFLLYTGVESTAGQWTYTLFTESRGVPAYLAGALTSLFWAMLTLGRVVFGALAMRIGTDRLLRLSMAGTFLAAILLVLRSVPGGFVAIGLMGLSLSAIFPTLTAEAPRRVGRRHAANAIGLQTGAASVGFAILPGVAGTLAERLGLESLGPYLVICSLLMLLTNQAAIWLVRRHMAAAEAATD